MGCRARRNDAEWSFHSKELQRSPVPRKLFNPPRSELTKKVRFRGIQIILSDYGVKLKNERSAAGFRFIHLLMEAT